MEIPEADISITRERLAAGEVGQDFSREMSDPLLIDPDDDGLMLRANRFPKTPYDTLLVTRRVEPQLMIPQYALAQLRWADRGAVTEFHRSETFVNHFHAHMFPAQFAPITNVAGSFMAHWKSDLLDEGCLVGYPLPHIALASGDIRVIRDAMMDLNDKLEAQGQLFYQLTLKHEGTYLVVFVLWKKEQTWPFGFSGIGIVQSPDFGMSESEVTTKLRKIMVANKELSSI
jgi:hypothetical protein